MWEYHMNEYITRLCVVAHIFNSHVCRKMTHVHFFLSSTHITYTMSHVTYLSHVTQYHSSTRLFEPLRTCTSFRQRHRIAATSNLITQTPLSPPYTHVYLHSCTHALMHSCSHVFMYSCTEVIIYSCIYSCSHVFMYSYTYVIIRVLMYSCTEVIMYSCLPAPMNHVKYLRAGPAKMPFQNWYTASTNHFRLTDSVRWKSKRQLGWVINIVPHNLVRRIRFG